MAELDELVAALRAVADGRANAGIMKDLVLSESAVEKHINSIFAKLGLAPEPETHRRVAAVLAYLREVGRVSPPPDRWPSGGSGVTGEST